MRQKSDVGQCLSSEEAARLENILIDRIHIIRYAIVKVFGVTYDYLVDDCVGEVLLLACKKSDILLNHSNPGGWLVNASKNVAYNMIRKYQNDTKNVPIDDLLTVSSPEDVFEDMIFEDWIDKRVPDLLLSRLTNREREIYDMLFVQKKAPQEIADELHISVSTVRNIKKSIVDKIKNDVYTHNF